MTQLAKFGNKFTCYSCGCKFYDLNRPKAVCPRCSADQTHAPKTEPVKLKAVKRPPEPEEVEEDEELEAVDEEDFPVLDGDDDFDSDSEVGDVEVDSTAFDD